MITSELTVYKDAWEMINQMESYIKNFPREAKYSHGAKLRDEGVEMIKSICQANNAVRDRMRRIDWLEAALGHYESYRFIKRLAVRQRYMSEAQEAKIDRWLAVIGQQLMGWKLSEENKAIGQNRDCQGIPVGQ